MASSCFAPAPFAPRSFASPASFRPAPSARQAHNGSGSLSARHRSKAARARVSAAPALLAAVLLLVAGLAAPERPADQAAICQRHNGVDACRVW